MVAVQNKHFQVVKLLLAAPGVDVNSKDVDGRTSLWWAAASKQSIVTELLVRQGARAKLSLNMAEWVVRNNRQVALVREAVRRSALTARSQD